MAEMKNGYEILPGVISRSDVELICIYWLARFSMARNCPRVTWSPYWGQPNTIGCSRDSFQHLYRAHDFLWNEPFHDLTRETAIKLNQLRNLMLGRHPNYGTRVEDGRACIVNIVSWYPHGGYMNWHTDGKPTGDKLIHIALPLNYDYIGGLQIENAMPEKEMKLGDALLYDGSYEHRITMVEGVRGRLQMFPLGDGMESITADPRGLNTIPITTYLKAKAVCLEDKMRRMLGFSTRFR